METNTPQQIPSDPGLEFIAQQLRKPAGDFASEIADAMNRVNAPLYKLMFSSIMLSDHDRILEIGFGNGRFFNELISKVKNVQVYGIELSEEMVKEAAVLNSGPIKNGSLILDMGNSSHLPYADQFFEKVFCNMLIYFWDKPEVHLKEIHRVLKPGGKFYTGFRPRESMLQFPFVKHGFNLYSADEWAAILEKNAFLISEIRSQEDPAIEDDGEIIHLESICVSAVKNKNS